MYKLQILCLLLVLLVTACYQRPVVSPLNESPEVAATPTYIIYDFGPLPDDVLTFQGEVVRGEVFEHPISPDLVFRLNPHSLGWTISISPVANPDLDFIPIVTVPTLTRNNPRVINGWHFRNSDNTGQNVPGEKSVNAPQHSRTFFFLLSEQDYKSAIEAHESFEFSYFEIGRKGRLTITQLELGNLIPNESAWIESMAFEVELSLPENFR